MYLWAGQRDVELACTSTAVYLPHQLLFTLETPQVTQFSLITSAVKWRSIIFSFVAVVKEILTWWATRLSSYQWKQGCFCCCKKCIGLWGSKYLNSAIMVPFHIHCKVEPTQQKIFCCLRTYACLISSNVTFVSAVMGESTQYYPNVGLHTLSDPVMGIWVIVLPRTLCRELLTAKLQNPLSHNDGAEVSSLSPTLSVP